MTSGSTKGLLGALGLAVAMTAAGIAHADHHESRRGAHGRDGGVHQDAIMEALKRKEIRPLAEVTAAAEKAMPGQIVGMKVKRLDKRLVYEFKIITEKGRVREVYIDAQSLDVLKIE